MRGELSTLAVSLESEHENNNSLEVDTMLDSSPCVPGTFPRPFP